MNRNRKTSGFTLVEILIVVIILGILAAIVIPQFTNASQDARKNSLTSQLQTIRSQLELSKLQHLDQASPDLVAAGAEPWDQLTVKTDNDYTVDAAGAFGPYLNSAPTNSLNGGTLVVANTDATEPAFGAASGATSSPKTSTGWVYYVPTGKIFATSKDGTTIYNEVTGDGLELIVDQIEIGGGFVIRRRSFIEDAQGFRRKTSPCVTGSGND